jgi:hypothetical protein
MNCYNPKIPFFSPIRRLYEPEAIIPLFHGLLDGKKPPRSPSCKLSEPEAGVKPKPGPLDPDLYFFFGNSGG